jgi:hypothetical protein
MVWRESAAARLCAAGVAASTASPEYQLSDYGSLAPRPRRRPWYGHACASMKRLALDPNTGMLVQEALDMFYGHETGTRWTCVLDGWRIYRVCQVCTDIPCRSSMYRVYIHVYLYL